MSFTVLKSVKKVLKKLLKKIAEKNLNFFQKTFDKCKTILYYIFCR